jgi:hypothetical protein
VVLKTIAGKLLEIEDNESQPRLDRFERDRGPGAALFAIAHF